MSGDRDRMTRIGTSRERRMWWWATRPDTKCTDCGEPCSTSTLGTWLCGACGAYGDVLGAEAVVLLAGMAAVRRLGKLGGER